MITRTYDRGTCLYGFNECVKGHSLGTLIRTHAQDFTEDDFDNTMNFIKEEIEYARTLQRKINLYGLYETLYYAVSQNCDIERCSKMLLQYQRDFMRKIINEYNINNY